MWPAPGRVSKHPRAEGVRAPDSGRNEVAAGSETLQAVDLLVRRTLLVSNQGRIERDPGRA